VLEFFNNADRQRRMEESEVHHDRAPMAGIVRELEWSQFTKRQEQQRVTPHDSRYSIYCDGRRRRLRLPYLCRRN
jgi:hypothetical protein